MIKKCAILGSTGSIGTQALDVCLTYDITVVALACASNIDLLYEQIQVHKPKFVAVANLDAAKQLRLRLNSSNSHYTCPVLEGDDGILAVAKTADVDMVLAAMVGMKGITAVLEAIKAGHDIALANKEVLVAAGDLVMAACKEHSVSLHPVDSEHSAIWQCLMTGDRQSLRRIILTASGGPFRGFDKKRLEKVTVEDALKHPTWDMGRKISIDSATMVNKGLEVIEAAKLFQLTAEEIDVVVHKESIVHSLVEWQDGSVIAQLSNPDMRLPIGLAFSWPDRLFCPDRRLDLVRDFGASLSFEDVDLNTFSGLGLAYEALKQGGSLPLVYNAANEVLVDAFLDKRIGFLDISRILEDEMNSHVQKAFIHSPSLGDIMDTDCQTRQLTKERIGWRE